MGKNFLLLRVILLLSTYLYGSQYNDLKLNDAFSQQIFNSSILHLILNRYLATTNTFPCPFSPFITAHNSHSLILPFPSNSSVYCLAFLQPNSALVTSCNVF